MTGHTTVLTVLMRKLSFILYLVTVTESGALIEENPTFPELEPLEVDGASQRAFNRTDDNTRQICCICDIQVYSIKAYVLLG